MDATCDAGIAQLVEHNLAMVRVADSSSVSRSKKVSKEAADGRFFHARARRDHPFRKAPFPKRSGRPRVGAVRRAAAWLAKFDVML